MFSARGHVRNLVPISPSSITFKTWGRRSLCSTCGRWASPVKKLDRTVLRTSYPVAEKLDEKNIWVPLLAKTKTKTKTGEDIDEDSQVEDGDEHENNAADEAESKEDVDPPTASKSRKTQARTKRSKGKSVEVKGDKTRINIVSEKLCDQIIKYIGPSLKRHQGCDIIDIYPGAGVWSQKLHQFLKPRSHILLEPDEDLYRPFLKPILQKRGSLLIPKSGVVWRELNSILTPEYLPHQKPIENTSQPQRNDTLLVTANIAFHPPRKFQRFESIALLLLHQFLDSIRTSSLFQRYGQVRMLIWSRHDDKGACLPKNMQRRKRGAIWSELYCEWVREVCGRDGMDASWFIRDTGTDLYSTASTLQRMREARMRVPKDRASIDLRQAKALSKARRERLPGSAPPTFKRPFIQTLSDLESAHQMELFGPESEEYRAMKLYQWRETAEDKRYKKMHDLMSGLDALTALYRSGEATAEELERLGAEWHDSMRANKDSFNQEFTTYRDNLHFIRQDPPVMHWDRRLYEPLIVQPDEFFPNIECTLLDIQPKDVHPLIRQVGPQSSRGSDTLELLMGALMSQSIIPMSRVLDTVWPGAAEFILPRWTSIRDLEHGGVPPIKSPYAEITPRMLNARQWEELLELWMQWPFRPEYHELIARTHDTEDPNSSDDDGAMGPSGN